MGKTEQFQSYLTTAFSDKRDPQASYRFYEGDYGQFLPEDKGAAIIDIGCGTGEFISYLTSKGYTHVTGVDASAEMVDFCKRNNLAGVSVVDDIEHYLSDKPERFDLITLNDTIEHFPKGSTLGILKAIRASLKNGGTLLVRTGNFSTFAGIYLRYKDFTHEVGYTEYSLGQVLRMAGFSDVTIKGNKCYTRPTPKSLARTALLRLWFLILKGIYLIELGEDRPTVYSKLLVAICKK